MNKSVVRKRVYPVMKSMHKANNFSNPNYPIKLSSIQLFLTIHKPFSNSSSPYNIISNKQLRLKSRRELKITILFLSFGELRAF